MDTNQTSPQISPEPIKVNPEMNFPAAMRTIIMGSKVTKLEWDNENVYGVLRGGFLMLHKEDDKDYQWTISEGDILGEDFIVVNNK